MKNIFKKLSLVLLPLLFIGCKNYTDKDACNCIKKTANEFMLQGIKITDIDDLKEPCEDILEGFRKDPKARAKIAACANEVFASIEQKKLIEIKGEILEEFPVLEYENLNDFYSEIKSNKGLKDQAYKLHNSKIIFKSVFVFAKNERLKNKCDDGSENTFKEVYISDNQSSQSIGNTLDAKLELKISGNLLNEIKPSLNFSDNCGVLDLQEERTIPYYYEDASAPLNEIADVFSNYKHSDYKYNNYNKGDYYYLNDNYSRFSKNLNTLINECGFKDFKKDVRNGRYIFIYDNFGSDNTNHSNMNEYQFLSKNLKNNFGLYHAMSKGQISGVLKTYKEVHIQVNSLKLSDQKISTKIKPIKYSIDEIYNLIDNDVMRQQ